MPRGTEVLDFLLAVHTSKNENSCCSTSSPTFDVISVLDLVHSNRSAVTFHCCFNLLWWHMLWSMLSYLFAIFVSSLVRYVIFGPFFKSDYLLSYSVLRFIWMFWRIVLYHICPLQIFFPVCGLTSYSLDIVFFRVAIFNFNEVQLINFLHGFWIVPLVSYLKIHHHTQDPVHFSYVILQKFYTFAFYI